MKKVFLNEFTALEIQEMQKNASLETAITVFGSCESHGWHMCLGPDLFVPTEIARRVAMNTDKTVVVPGVPFGTSIHYNQFPLSVTLRYSTTISIAEDIFLSLLRNGIKKIIILNGHDGNIPALEIAARNVKDQFKDASIIFIPAWWEIVGARMGEDFEAWNGLGHGGEGETSMTMVVKPDLVDLKHAACELPEDVIALSKGITVISDIAELTATGATGDSTKASREKGEKMMGIIVDYITKLIKRLDETDWMYDYKK